MLGSENEKNDIKRNYQIEHTEHFYKNGRLETKLERIFQKHGGANFDAVAVREAASRLHSGETQSRDFAGVQRVFTGRTARIQSAKWPRAGNGACRAKCHYGLRQAGRKQRRVRCLHYALSVHPLHEDAVRGGDKKHLLHSRL